MFRKDFFQEVGLEWLFNLYSGGDRDSKVLVIRFLRELATKPTSLDDLIENEEMLEIYTELLEFQHASEPGTSFVISGILVARSARGARGATICSWASRSSSSVSTASAFSISTRCSVGSPNVGSLRVCISGTTTAVGMVIFSFLIMS